MTKKIDCNTLNNFQKQLLLDIVRQNGNSIRHIINATEEMQLESVRQNGDNIRHIEHPTEEVKKVAEMDFVEKFYYFIEKENKSKELNLKNMTKKIDCNTFNNFQKQLLLRDSIRHIEHPTEEVKKVAEMDFLEFYYFIKKENKSKELQERLAEIQKLMKFQIEQEFITTGGTNLNHKKVLSELQKEEQFILSILLGL